MSRLAHRYSVTAEHNQQQLSLLNKAIFVLRAQCTDELAHYHIEDSDICTQRAELTRFLEGLEKRLRFSALRERNLETDWSYTELARQLIRSNPENALRIVSNLKALRSRVADCSQVLTDEDFRILRNLREHLQQEVDDRQVGLYDI